MWIDPVVEEIRKHSEEYASSHQHDLRAIVDDLKARQQKEKERGRKVVSLYDKHKGDSK